MIVTACDKFLSVSDKVHSINCKSCVTLYINVFIALSDLSFQNFIGVGRFRILGGPRFRILGGPRFRILGGPRFRILGGQGGAKFLAGT